MKKKRRSRAKVQRLRFFGPDGKPYERHPKTEDNIAELLPLPHAERAAKAPFALNETLVYLIRRADSKSGPYYDVWCDEISKRLVGLAEYYTRELPEPTASDIVMKVQSDFERILFAERASARTDFLEVAFALAVKKRTLQLVNLYVSSPWTQQSKAAADDEETERELQGIPEKGPGARRAPCSIRRSRLWARRCARLHSAPSRIRCSAKPQGSTGCYYMATMTGERALAHAKATSTIVADFLGDFA